MKLTDEQVAELEKKFLNQRVELKGDGGRHVGVVDFIGYNKYATTYGFQVTLSRKPVSNVDVKSIKIFNV